MQSKVQEERDQKQKQEIQKVLERDHKRQEEIQKALEEQVKSRMKRSKIWKKISCKFLGKMESKFDEVRKEFNIEQEEFQQEIERSFAIMYEKQLDWVDETKRMNEECKKGFQEMEKNYKKMEMNMKEKDEKIEQEIVRISKLEAMNKNIDQIEKYIKEKDGGIISED